MDAVLVMVENNKSELIGLAKTDAEKELELAKMKSRMKNQKNELTAGNCHSSFVSNKSFFFQALSTNLPLCVYFF
jgi:hypothetical protein